MALTYGFCLGSATTSKQFSEAIAAATGDGVCIQGGMFKLALQSGLSIAVGSGFALVNGRYLQSDGTEIFTLSPSGNTQDRYDAVLIRADYNERRCELYVQEDVEPETLTRNESEYNIALYLIHVKRGATVLYTSDITDLRGDIEVCGYITPLSEMSRPVIAVYRYLTQEIDIKISMLYGMLETLSDEIDTEFARVFAQGEEIADNADAGIKYLDNLIGEARGTSVGEIAISMDMPVPYGEWLLCDGSSVPDGYSQLSIMLNGILPDLTQQDTLFKAWIYCGRPDEPGNQSAASEVIR